MVLFENMDKTRARGFTLIELLAVIAIIGILGSAVIAAVGGAREKARDAKRIAEVKEIKDALNMYHELHNTYPSTTPDTFTGEDAAIKYLATPDGGDFLQNAPVGTGGGEEYFYRGVKSDGTECLVTGETCTDFVVGVVLERKHSSLEKDSDRIIGTFNGTSADCLGAAGEEYCYDISNN